MKTAIATALGKVLRGGRSGASLLQLQAGGRRLMPLEDALAPRLGATAPPPVPAAAGMGGSGAYSQSQPLLQALGRRVTQEGGLLPRRGAAAPPSAAAAAAAAAAEGMGSGAFSQSPLQAVGRRLPQERGLASLLPRLGATVPSSATPWRFHQMVGLCSSVDAGEQLASEEYMASVQNLVNEIKAMEDKMEFAEKLWWLSVGLALYMGVTLPERLVRLWLKISERARELSAIKERLKRIDENISHLERSAAAPAMMPTPILPAAPSATASDY